MANTLPHSPSQSSALLFYSLSNCFLRLLLNADSYHHYDLEVHKEHSLRKEKPNMTITINQNQAGEMAKKNQLQKQQVISQIVFWRTLCRRIISIMMNLLLLCCHLWESLYHMEGNFLLLEWTNKWFISLRKIIMNEWMYCR